MIKWEKPMLISLSGTTKAHGDCQPGSSDINGCFAGPSAGGDCESGRSATSDCADGIAAATGSCGTGGSFS